jgi:hypothetical protein
VGVDHKRLVESYKADPAAAVAGLRAAIDSKQMRPTEFDFGKLFVECFGLHEFYACREGKQSTHDVFKRVSEGDAGVTTAAFQNISGQIVYAATLEKYQSEEFVFAKMIPEVKALILDGEKMAGITEIGDVSAVRKENDPYQEAGVGEDWIYTPPVPDYGRIVSVTWEAVFNDRTGQLLERCGEVGYWIGYGEEVKAIDCVVDENDTTHRYNWRTAGQIATYDDNTGSHTWDNLAATNALVDWTDLDAAEQLFNGLTNPFTGTPIMIEPRHLVVTKQLEQTARRVVSATEIRVTTPGYAVSANPNQAVMANPYLNKYEVVTSRLLAARMATDTSWFLGDVTKLAKRMVAEPLNVVQAPPNSNMEFERRIVSRFRANKRYAHVTVQPRSVVKNTA